MQQGLPRGTHMGRGTASNRISLLHRAPAPPSHTRPLLTPLPAPLPRHSAPFLDVICKVFCLRILGQLLGGSVPRQSMYFGRPGRGCKKTARSVADTYLYLVKQDGQTTV